MFNLFSWVTDLVELFTFYGSNPGCKGGGSAAGPGGAGSNGGNFGSAGGGGGGAGGPNLTSPGSVGGLGTSISGAGGNGGGGTGGGASVSSGPGIAGTAGTGGGGSGGCGPGTANGGAGGSGSAVWTSTAGPTAGLGGAGGGAGGTTTITGGAGGLYGAGGGGGTLAGGAGAQGIIVFTYLSAAVTRYWVGGTGTWDATSTTNWSATSGGASGASAPALNDNVIIDASSGTGTITCTAGVCNNLTVTASQAIILGAAASTLSIYGNLSLPSGGSFTLSALNWFLNFSAGSTGKTITTNGKSIGPDVTFNGVGGGWTLQDNLTMPSDKRLTLTHGSFNANNFNVTIGDFRANNSNTKTLTMGSGTWTLAINGGIIWIASATGTTFSAGTSTIAISDTSINSKTFQGGGLTYNNLSITGATGIAAYIFTGANTFNSISSSKTVAYTITLPSSTTTTVTTWSATGSSGNLLTLNSSTSGTAATIAATNAFTVNYGTIQDVNISTTLKGTATNSTVINSNNWQVATTSTRWLNPLVTATNYNTITTPSDWPTTAVSNIYVIGGGGGGAGGVSTNLAGGAGGGGGGYALLANTTLAASTSYIYRVGAGGTGSAGGATNQTGNTGSTTAWNIVQNTISFVSSLTSVRDTALSNIVVTVPAGVSNGNLMVMICQANVTTVTYTTPTGWTVGTASVQGRVVFWRIASSEPGTYTVTMSAASTASAFILAYSNASFDTSGLASQTTTTPIQPVAITVAAPNSRVVYVTFRDGASTTFTTPTGYTARAFDSNATAPSGATFDIANIAAGSYTAPTSTPSGGTSGRGFVLALSPTTTSGSVSATGGAGGTSTTTPTSTGGAGGTGSGGTTNYTGGTGGAGAISGTKRAGGGGGGAAGLNGIGRNGGVGFNGTNSGGGGGGGNGGGTVGAAGTDTAGGTGGNNSLGTGGGTTNTAGTLGGGGGGGWVSGGGSGAVGTAGGNGIDIIVGLYGSGGGAGGAGSNFNAGGTGGLYGGGGSGASIDGTTLRAGGNGAQGAIFVGYTGTYVPSGANPGNFFFLFM